MPVTTPYKRAWLMRQALAADAAVPPITLLARLEAQLAEIVDLVGMSGGLAITSTSGNGHSTSFSESSELGIGPDGITELIGEMIDRHTRAAAALEIASPVAGDNAALLEQMLAGLVAAREVRSSYIGLRHR